MGEFLGPVDREEIIKRLLAAYADEWVAGYYYTVTAYSIKGPLSEEIAEHFLEEAKEEILKHAKAIADRLQDFDVDPPREFSKLWELSKCKYPPLPNDPYNIDAWIEAAVRAEECAVESYRELYRLVKDVDPVTEELAEDLLADEVRHRTALRNLLSRR
ncbi:MAG: ferritin-like domain-containing protein [Pyrobaculum sp.]